MIDYTSLAVFFIFLAPKNHSEIVMQIITIIASKRQGTDIRSWNEYLCLATGKNKRHQLFNGAYELLDAAKNYQDKNTKQYDLPKKIEGKSVFGVEGDWVVGGKLSFQEPRDHYEFDDLDDEDLLDWLVEMGWSTEYQKIVNILL